MHATTWINLEYIMLSEKSQLQKATYYMTLYDMPRIGKSMETESKLVVS